ncbi:unnamed protein product, partial [Durusdinium trenchii]
RCDSSKPWRFCVEGCFATTERRAMNTSSMFIATEPVPMWPGFPAKDETHPNSDAWHWWSPPPNVWIPSYIAYGLVDTITPLYGAMGAMTGSPGLAPEKQGDIQKGHDTGPSTKRSSLGPEEQGFHQEMLRKLALHLAAQPEEVPDTVATAPSPETMVKECPSEPVHFCESNFFMPVDKEEGSDTPRSFCATPEEHGMPVWKDRNADASGYEENEPSHCVCVPSYIVHGLLEAWEGKSKKDRRFGPSEQSFHHEMLRKLALHLAAQPGEPSAQVPQAPAPAPQPKRRILCIQRPTEVPTGLVGWSRSRESLKSYRLGTI